MQSRRNFIGNVATGLAGTLAASNVLGANDRIRLGIIGPGARGTEILQAALACENVECIGASDVYTRRLEDVKKIAPNAKTYLDYRRMLEDKDIDAVLIATPQHLHCEHFTGVLGSGKHVYQEKTMAFTVDHAKRMRTAFQKDAGSTPCRSGISGLRPGRSRTQSRSTSRKRWGRSRRFTRTCTQYAARQAAVVAACVSRYDAGAHHLEELSGRGKPVDFDANRYINWRFFWDYRAATCTRICATSLLLVQGAGPENSEGRDHGGRDLSVEGRPRSSLTR